MIQDLITPDIEAKLKKRESLRQKLKEIKSDLNPILSEVKKRMGELGKRETSIGDIIFLYTPPRVYFSFVSKEKLIEFLRKEYPHFLSKKKGYESLRIRVESTEGTK